MRFSFDASCADEDRLDPESISRPSADLVCGVIPRLHISRRWRSIKRTLRQLFVRNVKKMDGYMHHAAAGRAFSPETSGPHWSQTTLTVHDKNTGQGSPFISTAYDPPSPLSPSSPSQPVSLSDLLARCTVHVRIKRASGLVASHILGSSDPYCTASAGGEQYQTRVVRQSLNPQWGETFVFSGSSLICGEEPIIEFECWSQQDDFRPDDFLGQCELDLRRIRDSLLDPSDQKALDGKSPEALTVPPVSCTMTFYVLKASGGKEKESFGELECDVWLSTDDGGVFRVRPNNAMPDGTSDPNEPIKATLNDNIIPSVVHSSFGTIWEEPAIVYIRIAIEALINIYEPGAAGAAGIKPIDPNADSVTSKAAKLIEEIQQKRQRFRTRIKKWVKNKVSLVGEVGSKVTQGLMTALPSPVKPKGGTMSTIQENDEGSLNDGASDLNQSGAVLSEGGGLLGEEEAESDSLFAKDSVPDYADLDWDAFFPEWGAHQGLSDGSSSKPKVKRSASSDSLQSTDSKTGRKKVYVYLRVEYASQSYYSRLIRLQAEEGKAELKQTFVFAGVRPLSSRPVEVEIWATGDKRKKGRLVGVFTRDVLELVATCMEVEAQEEIIRQEIKEEEKRNMTVSSLVRQARFLAEKGQAWLSRLIENDDSHAPPTAQSSLSRQSGKFFNRKGSSSHPPAERRFLTRGKYGKEFSLPLVLFHLAEPYNGSLLMHVGVGDGDNRPLIYGVPLASSVKKEVAGGVSLVDPSVKGGDWLSAAPSFSSLGKRSVNLDQNSRAVFDSLTSPTKTPMYKQEPLGFVRMTFESIKVSLPDVWIFICMKVGPFWVKTNLHKSSELLPQWSIDLPVYDPGTTFSMVLFYQHSKTSSDVFPYARRFVHLALAQPNTDNHRTIVLPMLAPDGGPKAKRSDAKGESSKGLPNQGKLVDQKACPWLPWMGKDVDHNCTITYRFRMEYPSYKRLAKSYIDPTKADSFYIMGLDDARQEELERLYREIIIRWLSRSHPSIPPHLSKAVLQHRRQKFKWRQLKANLHRAKLGLRALAGLGNLVEHLMSWTNPIDNLKAYFFILLFFFANNYCFLFIFGNLIRILVNRRHLVGRPYFGMEQIEDEDDEDDLDAPTNDGTLAKLKRQYEQAKRIGLKVQNWLDDVATFAEKIQSLFSWTDPASTLLVFCVLVVVCVLVYLLGANAVFCLVLMYILRPPASRDPMPTPPEAFLSRLPCALGEAGGAIIED